MNNLREQLNPLWRESTGSSSICVAVLDGPADLSHPCFEGANIAQLTTLASGSANQGAATRHGTHVASIIFGRHDSLVPGIAPGCRGLIVPVFTDGGHGELAPCSQIDLARAITQAVGHGANIINISGGQLAASAESDRLLANAVQLCKDNNVLIIAAAGNDGCECLHLPAAIETVLAVGAMTGQDKPLPFSNWGEAYKAQGILALGEDVLVAATTGRVALKSGTSYATPIVSGVAALLLSIQKRHGQKPDPHGIKEVLLNTALPCAPQHSQEDQRCLAGRLNISGAYTKVVTLTSQPMFASNPKHSMTESIETVASDQPTADSINHLAGIHSSEVADHRQEQLASLQVDTGIDNTVDALLPITSENPLSKPSHGMGSQNYTDTSVMASGVGGDCKCSTGGTAQLVYALGQLGTDFGTQARNDSFTQAMPPDTSLLEYLDQNPWEAQSIIWTLNLDATPIYAILPNGAFSTVTYERLRQFLADPSIERVSIPGYIGGKVRLMSGQVVPAIIPDVRGMCSWSTDALVASLIEISFAPQELTPAQNEDFGNRIREFMDRIYYDFRNLGVTPQERALNFAATNLFQAASALGNKALKDRDLDSISVERSPICRPDSDCYDVKISFFDPENSRRSRRISRYTVDVSDVVPVTVGAVRSWSQV
jgi:cyanobactin maturation PatA/PatG family protease